MEDEEPAAATGGVSLPGYSLLPQSSSSDAASAFQFDIVPRSDASSFQAGYQGLQERGFQVWIRGDVLLKGPPQAMTRCSIRLVAEETAESRSLTLHDASQVLWTSPTQPTTSSAPAYDAQPPSMMPFEFSLPQHLPHCLHLPDVKLEYRLVATLEGVDQPHSKTVAVHVTRYSAPGPLKQLLPSSSQQRFSDEAKVWKRTTPTDIEVTLARTLFRRGDHIPLRIQVAAPHDKLIAKGLRIRSVEAELVRTIEAKSPQPEAASTSNSKAKQKDGEGVWEPHEHLLEGNDQHDPSPPSSSTTPPSAERTRHRTVLAYSGKACRFSLSRPLVLHLTLVPPFTSPALPHPSPDHDAPPAGLSPLTAGSAGGGGGCESITQQTALSSVSFAVKVYIRMRGPSASGAAANATANTTAPGSSSASPSAPTENQDVVLESDVYILPALAGAGDAEAEGESEAANEAAAPHGVSWPTDEEEFDGYEDFQDSREVFEEEEQAAAAIAASQPRIDVNGDQSINGGTSAAAAVRRPSYHPSGADEPPPTVQQSQHDLQIFPPGSAGHGGDDDAFPPPHSERQDVNEVPSYDEGESEPTSATMPPAWTARTTEPIDGVGEGERRYPPHHHHGVQAPSGLTRPAQGSYEAPPLASPPPEFDDASHAQQQPFALPSEQQTHLHLEPLSSMQQGTQEHHRRQRGTSAVEPPPYMTMMAATHAHDVSASPPPPPSSPPSAFTSPSSPPPPPPLSPGAYYSSSHDEAGGSTTPLATTSRVTTNGNSNGAPSASSSSSYPTAAEEKEALALSMAMANTSVATGPAEEGSSQSGGDQDEFVDAPEDVVGSEEEVEHGVDDELPPGYEA